MNERFDASKWIYWGRWPAVMLFQSPWLKADKTEAFRKLKIDFLRFDMKILDGHFYFLVEDLDKLYDFVVEKLEHDAAWFEEFFSICERKTTDMLAIENRDDLKEFINRMIESFGCSLLIDFVDKGVEKYLKEKCELEGLQFSEIISYIKFPRKTELLKYRVALRNLEKKDSVAVEDFAKKFGWVTTYAFTGNSLSKKEILEAPQEFVSSGRNEGKAKSYVGKQFSEIIQFASELSFYRSNLNETVNRVGYSHWENLIALGKKYELSFEEITSLTEDELFRLIDDDTAALPRDFKKRGTDFGLVFLSHNLTMLLSDDTKKELEIHNTEDFSKIREVKGYCAFPGKVIGKAKIVYELKEIGKVLPGDILIASETEPSFVIAMQKAAAFVTDVGGLTCHAAIIAREMKKPCVIATKIATKVFKDNELVEVNATNGIARKL